MPHQTFIARQRRELLDLSQKVLWDNASGHPEPHEFNSKGIKVVYLPPNTKSLFQPLDQGVIGPLTFALRCRPTQQEDDKDEVKAFMRIQLHLKNTPLRLPPPPLGRLAGAPLQSAPILGQYQLPVTEKRPWARAQSVPMSVPIPGSVWMGEEHARGGSTEEVAPLLLQLHSPAMSPVSGAR
ncbi:hypothetical protein QTO34_017341, partial [Cnephaeus nilssonii]